MQRGIFARRACKLNKDIPTSSFCFLPEFPARVTMVQKKKRRKWNERCFMCRRKRDDENGGVNRSSNSITTVNRAGAHRRENKRSPDKGGPGALLVRARPIVCAHTLNVLSSWSRAKSAGPAKRARSTVGSDSAAEDCRRVCH